MDDDLIFLIGSRTAIFIGILLNAEAAGLTIQPSRLPSHFFFMRGLVKAVCMMYKLVNANFLNGIYSSFTIHPFRKMQIHRKRR